MSSEFLSSFLVYSQSSNEVRQLLEVFPIDCLFLYRFKRSNEVLEAKNISIIMS